MLAPRPGCGMIHNKENNRRIIRITKIGFKTGKISWKTNKRRRPPRCWRRGPRGGMIHAGDYLQTLPWHLNTLHHGPRIHHVLLDLPRYSIDRDKDKDRVKDKEKDKNKDRGKDKYIDKKTSQHFTLCHKFRWPSCCSNSACYVLNKCAPLFDLKF